MKWIFPVSWSAVLLPQQLHSLRHLRSAVFHLQKSSKLLSHSGHKERKGIGCSRAGSVQWIHPRTQRLAPPCRPSPRPGPVCPHGRWLVIASQQRHGRSRGPGLQPASPLGPQGRTGDARERGHIPGHIPGDRRGPRPPRLRRREAPGARRSRGAPASARQVAPEQRPLGGCGGAGAPAAPARCGGGGGGAAWGARGESGRRLRGFGVSRPRAAVIVRHDACRVEGRWHARPGGLHLRYPQLWVAPGPGPGLGRAGRRHGLVPRGAGASPLNPLASAPLFPLVPAAGSSERSCLTKWRRARGGGAAGRGGRHKAFARAFVRFGWVGWGVFLPPAPPVSPLSSVPECRGVRPGGEGAGVGAAVVGDAGAVPGRGWVCGGAARGVPGLLPDPWAPPASSRHWWKTGLCRRLRAGPSVRMPRLGLNWLWDSALTEISAWDQCN